MRGGGVSAGSALPGLLPEPFLHKEDPPAAFRCSLFVPGLQNERNCPPDCQQAFHLHRQLCFCLRHPGKSWFYKKQVFICFHLYFLLLYKHLTHTYYQEVHKVSSNISCNSCRIH